MHEANFELIEIPHVRQSGKNSADIRLVVDALDLCYTKSHVDTFVIISGDSDFSPLVSKLRENAKHVIGVGVKQSTSDLLVANCDEFIFYDDLVRESQPRRGQAATTRKTRRPPRAARRRSKKQPKPQGRTGSAQEPAQSTWRSETFEALVAERGDSGKIWASAAEGGDQAPQARLQRDLFRLPHLRQPAGRSAGTRPARDSAATKNPAPMSTAAAGRWPLKRRWRRSRRKPAQPRPPP